MRVVASRVSGLAVISSSAEARRSAAVHVRTSAAHRRRSGAEGPMADARAAQERAAGPRAVWADTPSAPRHIHSALHRPGGGASHRLALRTRDKAQHGGRRQGRPPCGDAQVALER